MPVKYPTNVVTKAKVNWYRFKSNRFHQLARKGKKYYLVGNIPSGQLSIEIGKREYYLNRVMQLLHV